MEKDKPNHPEVEDTKNICDIAPNSKLTKDVCDVLKKEKKKPGKKQSQDNKK
ncbi:MULTISPECIES: hypothetical protein [unclassified Legionella]|uniref:hypothetical protein n=1 Tax=unclassified Legionella TaxID=2622702 RepID=UPI0013EF7A6A|nr:MULTISPECIES: hypothetical protein [unclassified Legionella]MDI9818389.1 hypothetical protein [Legionella sp. PL877]